MEAAADGGGGDGVFATAVNADDGMMAGASTVAGQARTTTAIAATTTGQGSHRRQCNHVIALPSHCHLRQG
jgi:hypothetical protein